MHNTNRLTATIIHRTLPLPAEVSQHSRSTNDGGVVIELHPKVISDRSSPALLELTSSASDPLLNIASNKFSVQGYSTGDRVQFSLLDSGNISITYLSDSIEDQFTRCEFDERGRPIPPAWLVQAFVGAPISLPYADSGAQISDFFIEAYERNFGSFDDIGRIMDFGCGCGRVVSALSSKKTAQYFGVDLHRDAIEWMRLSMPDGTFLDGSLDLQLHQQLSNVDLLYAISVFTHLNEQNSLRCMQDWRKTVSKDGCLMVTFRDETWMEEFCTDPNYGAWLKIVKEGSGMYYNDSQYWNGIFPEFYSDAYHSYEYVERTWGEIFELKEIIGWQDSSGAINQNIAILSNSKV